MIPFPTVTRCRCERHLICANSASLDVRSGTQCELPMAEFGRAHRPRCDRLGSVRD